MNYFDGSAVALGDIVSVPVPGGSAKARVVMLGETYEHLDIDPLFLSWVKAEQNLGSSSVVVQWVEGNPFAHDNPKYAPVGDYLFSPIDKWVKRVA